MGLDPRGRPELGLRIAGIDLRARVQRDREVDDPVQAHVAYASIAVRNSSRSGRTWKLGSILPWRASIVL